MFIMSRMFTNDNDSDLQHTVMERLVYDQNYYAMQLGCDGYVSILYQNSTHGPILNYGHKYVMQYNTEDTEARVRQYGNILALTKHFKHGQLNNFVKRDGQFKPILCMDDETTDMEPMQNVFARHFTHTAY